MAETSVALPVFDVKVVVSDTKFDASLAHSMANECVTNASSIVAVLTQQDLNDAGAAVKDIRKILGELEEHRKQIKQPFLEHGKKVDEFFKALTRGLDEQNKRLSDGMSTYNRQQQKLAQAKADEERRKMQEEADRQKKEAEAKGEPAPEIVVPEVVAPKVEKLSQMNSAGIASRRYKKWEVTDIAQVPVEYLLVNEVKMNKKRAEYDFNDQSPVPGIKFTVEEKV